MKKKILTLTFTLILLIGLVAAVGMNASAETAVIDISAATGVSNYADLVVYLDQLRPKIYIKLTSDIEVTDDARDLSLPVDASGTFVLDLNGYDIIVNSDNTTSIFNVGSNFSTEFHVINSASARSEITLNSIADKASVFYINDARSSLHIYDNISINVAADGRNYFYNPSGRTFTYGIRAGAFDTIAIHGADIYNRSAFGGGVLFSANVPDSKFIIDGDTEIISRFVGLNFAGIGNVTGYPDIQLEALHLAYDNAVPPVDNVSYNKVGAYTAIGGLASTKTKDIIGPSMQAFYGTSEPYSRFFSNDGDLINNLPMGNNLRIYATGCGHKSGYECYLRLFVPGKIRPLHFTVCSYCARNAAYNTCTFVTNAEATETADGHTAGYDCYCGYKTNAKIAKIASVKLSSSTVTYNGKVRNPSITVKDANGKALVNGTDYDVTVPSGRKNPGIYKYVVTFKGNYEGTKTLNFTINPETVDVATIKATQSTSVIKLTWGAVEGATGYRVYQYSPSKGKFVQIASVKGVTSYRKATNLKAGTEYKFKVKAYTKLSDGTVLWATASKEFLTATECKAPSITSVTSPSKSKATVKWSNVDGETGYQLYYSTKKTSGFKKVASYEANKLTGSKTFSSSASGKTIYFKVRAYQKVNGQTIFSEWSAVKSVKLK